MSVRIADIYEGGYMLPTMKLRAQLNPHLAADSGVSILAHQAGKGEAPASTMWAVRRAIENGATSIELDVHFTRDGHPVVHHDPDLLASAGLAVNISDLTLAELGEINISRFFDFPEGERQGVAPDHLQIDPRDLTVLSVDKLLASTKEHVRFNFDLKPPNAHRDGTAERLVNFVGARNMFDQCTFTSFSDANVRSMRRQGARRKKSLTTAPGAKMSVLFAVAPDLVAGRLASVGHSAVQLPAIMKVRVKALQALRERTRNFGMNDYYEGMRPGPHISQYLGAERDPENPKGGWVLLRLDERHVRAAHRAGIGVDVWTVNDPVEMARLAQMGVDGIITDYVTTAANVIPRQHGIRADLPFLP